MSMQYKSILESVRSSRVSFHTDVYILYGLLYNSPGTWLITQEFFTAPIQNAVIHFLIHLLTISQYWQSSLTVFETSNTLNHDIIEQLSFKNQGGTNFILSIQGTGIKPNPS
jgi:hypothetical protein